MNFRFSLSCLLLLAAGCRGPQAAFHFAPAPTQATVAATPVLATLPEPAAAAPAARRAAGVHQPKPLLPHAPRHARRAVAVRAPRVQPVATTETAAHRPARTRFHLMMKPHQSLLEHTGAFVLGVALVAGGVVVGLLLGGWLGLGVGALVVLGGYYFLGVGLGGKHAWLEVFQEFFNM